MPTVDLDVAPSEAGERLDRYLSRHLEGQSRTTLQKLITAGKVTVNDVTVRPSRAVCAGDRIKVALPDACTVEEPPASSPLSILYEDDAIIVINKPAGLVVHGAGGHRGETLVSALRAQYPDIAQAGMDPERPGIVHRLDRDTSGVLLVARTPDVLAHLQRQFRRREVRKEYLALVHGVPTPSRAAIEAPIARDRLDRTRMAIAAQGRYARTEYTVMERLADAALLSVVLITGRTHQIRVHMASIGHPVIGDRTYGPRRAALAPRQMLHAHRLTLSHPVTLERMTWEAPMPADMQAQLERLRPPGGGRSTG